MRNKLTFFTASLLMISTAFAEQDPNSVEAIMEELMNYTGPDMSALQVAQPEIQPATVTQPIETVEPVEMIEPAVNPENTAPVVQTPDKPSEQTPREFPASEVDAAVAQQRIAEAAAKEPERGLETLYPRTLLERDHRTAEKGGMDAVKAGWSTDLVLRPYTLAAGADKRMKLGETTGPVDVETLFPQVEFPKGTSAIYQPKTKTIFVRNTPKNLAMLDTMLETMGVLEGSRDAEQVEIEAKFVEVSEGTLENLGFQWNFADGTQLGAGGTDVTVDDGSGLFSDALRGSPIAGPGGVFSRTIDLGDGAVSASGDWSSFRFADTFSTVPGSMTVNSEGDFSVLINALDQSTGTDVLSAPRVLTRSGEEATIQVGELHSFPEVYESDASQATIVHISYQDFSEKLLGVELTVNPKVTSKRQIQLELNPRITELAGWQEYQLAPADYIYGYYQEFVNAKFDHEPVVAKLPIFKRREVQTQVTIADGSTIGMGGLINEKTEAFDDRVPVLGSLPLVGRLFRNEGERAVKRNLLMFVTAKVVEPNGRISTARSFE